MNILPLAIPLTALLTCSNLCASAFACLPRFVLNASADRSPLLAGDLGLHLVMFVHDSGFPLTDATSHELRAVGFSHVAPFHEEIEHAYISAIVIHFKLAPRQPREQARANIPPSLEREPVAIRNTIAMMGCLAINGLHQEEFEIIGRSQI